MRILIVNYEYPPVGGGAAVVAEALASEFVNLGHRVCVLTGRFKGLPAKSEENGITIRRVPSLRRAIDRCTIGEMISFLIAGLILAPSIIRKQRIQRALVLFSLPCGPIGLLGLWMCGVPYVLSLQAGDVPGAERSVKYLHRLLAPIRRTILKNSIGVVANSEGLRKLSEAADPISVHVVPNGVDTDLFCPSITQSRAERSDRRLRMLFVGRFQDQKNLGFLLEQLALLRPGTFELHLVGDGPQRKSLRKLASELGIGGCISWHGWVPRAVLPTIYQSADCFVNSSLYEGMPIAVLEAMACGLPVIASNVIGNADLVLNGETGFLFDPGDSNGFVAALNQLQDVDLRRQMGKQGRARVLECFSWKTAAAQYANLLSAGGASVRLTHG